MGEFDFKVINAEEEIQHIIDEIKRYFLENGNKDTKAVIGISGGKDSTIAAALLVRALGPERVFGVLMPDGDQKDIKDSVAVCEALHIPYRVHNIGPVTKMFAGMIGDAYNKPIVNTNTPARIRMTTLYAVAADIGGRVMNTGNASELYVGNTTKYGDLAGDFAILKDYYVREILEIGDNLDEIPAYLVHKAPADGMCGKTDEDNMGFSYDILDAYLLDEVMPDYDVFRNIAERHARNVHKRAVAIPFIRAKTRKWHEKSNKEPDIWF